jgi:hypothetical protein
MDGCLIVACCYTVFFFSEPCSPQLRHLNNVFPLTEDTTTSFNKQKGNQHSRRTADREDADGEAERGGESQLLGLRAPAATAPQRTALRRP